MVFLALAGIMLAGLFLRLYQIDKNPLWLDEGYSVWLSWNSIPQIIRYTIDIDQHPPFYYILLHLWMQIGGFQEAWVRALSAVIGTLSILVIFLLGRRMSGTAVGLLSALVLAFSPFHVQYGQEARTYALLTLCAVASMWMLARLLTDPRARTLPFGQQFEDFIYYWRDRRKAAASEEEKSGIGYERDFRGTNTWVTARTERTVLPLERVETDLTWIGYMLFTALTVYGHNTAIFLPIGINLFVFGLMLFRRFVPAREGQLQAPSFWNWFIAQVGVFLFWSPWLLAFYFQASGVAADFWIQKPTIETVLNTLKTFLLAHPPDRLRWLWLVWAGFGGAFVMALVKYRKSLGYFLLMAALFLTPFLGELLISIWRPIFYDRTLIWVTIPLYVLIAAGISQLRFKPYIAAAVVILVTLSWMSISNYYRYFEKERWDLAAAYVGEKAQEGDIIIFNAGWVQLPFDYYFGQYNHQVEKFGAPATLFERGELEPRMTEEDIPRLRAIMRGRTRIWLVYSHNWWTDPKSLIPETLSQEMKMAERKRFNGMEIQLYTVR